VNSVTATLRFSRRCMNSANAIPPRMNRHKTKNMTKLFAGIGTFSGKPCIRRIDLDQDFDACVSPFPPP